MKRENFIFFLILALLASCFNGDAEAQNGLESFTKMQESLIHAEEERRGYASRNENLEKSIENLNEEIGALAAEIERKNDAEEFSREIPLEEDVPSPRDRIRGEQIRVSRRNVLLDIRDVSWHFLLDTNSMDPFLDEGTNVLAVAPSSEQDIIKGDIVIFTSENRANPIVHRVIEVGQDKQGIYYLTKGDNNRFPDSRIRFGDIDSVLVGILY